jgi:hypothetical protein
MQPLDAVLLLDGDTLFAALYRASVSGCRVIALDARSGALRWETELEGVGPVAHSAYRTLVQMRLDPAGLVIYGNEFKGRYIEVLRRPTGGSSAAGSWGAESRGVSGNSTRVQASANSRLAVVVAPAHMS